MSKCEENIENIILLLKKITHPQYDTSSAIIFYQQKHHLEELIRSLNYQWRPHQSYN
jgi:hypothetical protein